jgi:malonyl-CoA O-methyltransferase
MTARSGSHAHPVSALETYERWADTYAPEPHNPLMAAEQRAVLGLMPDVRNRRVLDLACGTGRYSRLVVAARASCAVALDLSPAMLRRAASGLRIQASMDQLPFADASFDVVISGLALSHAPHLGRWMREAARVLVPGGTLLYSDFHPAASQRGLRRTFKDRSERVHAVAHCCHSVEAQRAAAAAAGLAVEHVLELRAGIEFVEAFDGAEAFYRREHGTPLVLVVRARKAAAVDGARRSDEDAARESATLEGYVTDTDAADESARDLSRRAVRDMDVAAGAPRDGFTASRRGRCRAGSRPQARVTAASQP